MSRPLSARARAVPMMRSDADEIPSGVRLLLRLVAMVAVFVGFWLVSGLVGWFAAAVSLRRTRVTVTGRAGLDRLPGALQASNPVPERAARIARHGRAKALSERAGCAVPLLIVMTGDGMKAFAVVGFRGNAIVVSRGLLMGRSNADAAVLAHEIAHLERRDPLFVSVRLLAAAAIVADETSIAARVATLGELAPLVPSLLLGTIPTCGGGGAAPRSSVRRNSAGRSPRARGSLPVLWGLQHWYRVDLRARRGALVRKLGKPFAMGRSPRPRGSLDHRDDDVLVDGSIPACAGEPP